jgi:hypothetical protein
MKQTDLERQIANLDALLSVLNKQRSGKAEPAPQGAEK